MGSAMCVPRLIRLIDARLSDVVSPLARSEIGTAAAGHCAAAGGAGVMQRSALLQHQHAFVERGVVQVADVAQRLQRRSDTRQTRRR